MFFTTLCCSAPGFRVGKKEMHSCSQASFSSQGPGRSHHTLIYAAWQRRALRESATATEQLREEHTSTEHAGEEEKVPWTNFGKKAHPSKPPPLGELMPPSTEASKECWGRTRRQCSLAAWHGEPDTERGQKKGGRACQRGPSCMCEPLAREVSSSLSSWKLAN